MRNDEELRVAVRAAKAAGRAVRGHFGSKDRVVQKSEKEFVTRSDIASQNIILRALSRAFPSYGYVSEEKSTRLKRSEKPLWIIDPLDGTHNFISGIPFFGISIGLYAKDAFQLGVIYFPLQKKLFTARRGSGAYCDGKRIRVSDNPKLSRAMVAYDNQFHRAQGAYHRYKRLASSAFTTRILGSAACDLCFIAEGVLDARVLNNAKLCDFAAGCVILAEAGGLVTDFSGKPVGLGTSQIAASNSRIHAELLKTLKV
jgi:myo-inositol-1(or 4)-monophosphatase